MAKVTGLRGQSSPAVVLSRILEMSSDLDHVIVIVVDKKDNLWSDWSQDVDQPMLSLMKDYLTAQALLQMIGKED